MLAPICTLVHISDLHFGSSFVIDGESAWRKWIARMPGLRHLSGAFPHSYQKACALAVAVQTILRERDQQGIPAIVVHTGDLTAGGRQGEYSVGRTFLRHGHYLENSVIAGLQLDNRFHRFAFDVPGNHDLWKRGSPKHSVAFTSHYGGPYPRVSDPISTAVGTAILYGLDSNRGSIWSHRLAKGEVPPAALHSLCTALRGNQRPGVVQVVCLHHPLFIEAGKETRLAGFEILRLRNREAIAQCLAQAGADVVLTGHLHTQMFLNKDRHRPLLFIAGSACQIDASPAFWRLDLYAKHVVYAYHHIPDESIQFVVDDSRSGTAAY